MLTVGDDRILKLTDLSKNESKGNVVHQGNTIDSMHLLGPLVYAGTANGEIMQIPILI